MIVVYLRYWLICTTNKNVADRIPKKKKSSRLVVVERKGVYVECRILSYKSVLRKYLNNKKGTLYSTNFFININLSSDVECNKFLSISCTVSYV